jgi:hypothetical protein
MLPEQSLLCYCATGEFGIEAGIILIQFFGSPHFGLLDGFV